MEERVSAYDGAYLQSFRAVVAMRSTKLGQSLSTLSASPTTGPNLSIFLLIPLFDRSRNFRAHLDVKVNSSDRSKQMH